MYKIFPFLMMGIMMNSCVSQNQNPDEINYGLKSTSEIIVTSEQGDKMAKKENVAFRDGKAVGTVLKIYPKETKQTMDGIGTSFTESSAFVLAHLNEEKRMEVMQKIYGEDGANFSLTRTHIGACDFAVDGKYSYADVKGDTNLTSFTLTPDKAGFDRKKYPEIIDTSYDLLPMIKEALAIKNAQNDKTLKIISSAWTAPNWMKDIEDWYIPGSPENNWQGTGGSLKEEYITTYADYLVKYLDAYNAEGVKIWGLTPVNEPHGNNGQWESMHFSPESQNVFVKKHLGPKLKSSGFDDVKLLVFDQNRDGAEEWADVIFGDKETAPFVHGLAVHWYESTFKVHEDVFDKIHEKFPDFAIIHTEGCIDDLGKDASDAIADPERFKEKNWFDNDAFWWNENATDWAYTASWAKQWAADHPIYTPVHRYARNIIVSIDHWLQGWIDWNIVLDKYGGPNHVGNFCGAPIMIDTKSKYVYYTPIYYVLAQFSRTIRPGDKAVKTEQVFLNLDGDALHACATTNADKLLSVQLLNTTKEPIKTNLQIGKQYAEIAVPANAVQTVQIQL
ncbi:MAG: glycosyl hydrolase [Calditrichaeota bacterium]|nr:MAG: glycosyl hydrolase [Calditrichota bacterium]